MHVVGDMFEPENKFIEVTNIYKTEENCLPLPFPPPPTPFEAGRDKA